MKKDNLKNDNKKDKSLKNRSISDLEKALKKEKEESSKIKALNHRLDANIQQLLAANEQIRASKHQLYIEVLERQQAEKKLRYSETMLKEAQHLAQIGSWELDFITNQLYWSDETYRIFGLKPSQFDSTYKNFLDNIHPDDREFVNKAYTDSVKNKTPYKTTHRLLLKDGSIKFINEQCETFYNKAGKPSRSMGTVQDVTERKKAEDALKESEEQYRLLAYNSMDVIWKMDLKMVFTYASPSIKDSFGYTVDEWVGNRLSQYCSGKEFFKMARKAVYAVKGYKKFKSLTFEAIMLRKNGSEIPVEITAKLIFNKNGFPHGFQGTTRDITERK
ncbi:MAG: PAS domain-containing protein, partial [Elusimicrobiales bacterium]|nr:PAS domain-containing protein [Elusimicrobiales bacterium]